MFTKTSIKVKKELLDKAQESLPNVDFKLALNEKTGRFFYDPWVISPQFKNTVWEEILNTIPEPIGEARIIILKPGSGYQSHSDIDDRFHLNLSGDKYSYLVNLDENRMYPVEQDLYWYYMNAGPRHSAINLGKFDRVQIVVRKLLPDTLLSTPVKVIISPASDNLHFRFDFDNVVSPWLNSAVKANTVSNFEFTEKTVSFFVSLTGLEELKKLNLRGFNFVEIR